VICAKCGAALADNSRFCGACGGAIQPTETAYTSAPAAAPPSAPDLVGREIAGRYRMTAKLGEGGMGAVYRAEQISLKRKVAVKLLRPELSSEPGLVRRFNTEAELAAKLNHPNTVNIYDFGQDADGTLFIAMEYVEGSSLRAVLAAGGAMPPARALHIVAQIASSLADAHAYGIVHRDLKPDNVMLTDRGKQRDVVRVLDFGIAKLRDDGAGVEQAMTRAGDLVGTPQYMAPEQIRAEPVDGRTDVYAVGAMLYEMITGRLPFEGPTLMAILSKHLTEVPEPPSKRRPDLAIPPALDALVLETLAKDPARRTPSMERLGERIAEVATGLGVAVGYGPPTGSTTAQVPTGAAAATNPASGFGSRPATSGPPGPPPAGLAPTSGVAPPGPPPGTPMTPGRPMRPPGVPHTYPPGMMMAAPAPPQQAAPVAAPPYAPSPYAPGHAPPAPLPSGTPPPPANVPYVHTPPRVSMPAPANSNRALVWFLVVLALAGVGVAVVVLIQNRDSGKHTAVARGSASAASGDDDNSGPGPAVAVSGSIDPWQDGIVFTTPHGSVLTLPAGMTGGPYTPGGQGGVMQYYTGTYNGATIRVLLIELLQQAGHDVGGDFARAMLQNSHQVNTGTQLLAGNTWPTVILDGKDIDDVTDLRIEVLSYADQARVLVLMVGTTPDRFDEVAALRTQIFSRRFRP